MNTGQINHRRCPLCGNTAVELLKMLSYVLFDENPLSPNCYLVACSQCGFIFFDTQSSPEEFYAYYGQNMHYLSDSSGTGVLNERETKRYASILAALEKHRAVRTSRVVDVGSAKGGFLSFLKKHGCQKLLAVDLLPECVEFAKRRGIDAKTGTAEKLPLADNSVDMVILSHVLEHIVDLKAAVEETYRVLRNGGLVYAEVPSLEYGCSFKHAPMWDLMYEHINYFSKNHLVSLFESHRFSCLATQRKAIRNGRGVIACESAIFKKTAHLAPKDVQYHTIRDSVIGLLGEHNTAKMREIKLIATNQTPCYVWGMSAYMQLLMSMTPIGQCNIISYVDKSKYKQTRTINGLPISSERILKNTSEKDIVIFPVEPYANSMHAYLGQIGFNGTAITV